MAGSLVVTGLRPALGGYLDLRRGLGFKLDRDAKLLDQFISYLEQRGTGTVTVTDALAWATLPANASPGWLRMRMICPVMNCAGGDTSQRAVCATSWGVPQRASR